MDSSQKLQNGLSICSGYGGIELGLSLAGVRHRTVAFLEIEAYAVANLVAKMEQGHLVPAPVWTNLKTFPMEAFRGRVDFITAGYPCQPFSCAGQRKGTDDPRHLWPHLRRIYKTIHPRWMLFENVEGHVTLGLSTVISDLEEDGYRTTWGLFTAAEVGAPHRRKRVFILAESVQSRTSGQCEDRALPKDGRDAVQSNRLQTTEEVDVGGNCDSGKPKELAHSNNQRERTGCGEIQKEDGKIPQRNDDAEFEQSSEIVADCQHVNVQRKRSNNDTERWEEPNGPAGLCCGTNWPSRPGEPQHEWEEPRTVERKLGGTADGIEGGVDAITNRVDRLRLCGNGVCPQQCAKAYKVLYERIKVAI